jgi:hypothetical protein
VIQGLRSVVDNGVATLGRIGDQLLSGICGRLQSRSSP